MIFDHQNKRRGLKLEDAHFRRYTWGAIGAAAVTVVGGAISSNQAKKRAGNVAQYENVNLQQEQQDALLGNLGAQGSIEDLLTRANTFQQGQANTLAEQAMPGYGALSQSLTARAQEMADNPYDVPEEVTKNLERLAAERGISAGTRGQFNDFSLLRDFGVNSLQYGQANIQGAQSITGLLSSIAPKVNPMSPLAFYVTPQQNAGNTTANNRENQAIAQGGINAQNAAANQGSTDLWSNLSQLAGAGLAAYGNNKTASKTGTGSGGAPEGGIGTIPGYGY
jgi:hypothetical protein